jgi:hypothetical protein
LPKRPDRPLHDFCNLLYRRLRDLPHASASAWSNWVPAFVQRLRQLDWIEERTIAIENRRAEGRSEGYAEIAA